MYVVEKEVLGSVSHTKLREGGWITIACSTMGMRVCAKE